MNNRVIIVLSCVIVLGCSFAAGQVANSGAIALKNLPGDLQWKVMPLDWKIDHGDTLTITAGKNTDDFVSPVDGKISHGAPKLLFPPDEQFVLSAKVTVDFRNTWDAGFLFVYADEENWAKLCFEKSIEGKPTIVTVVTRGVSDDSTSVPIPGNSVYLKIATVGPALFFYFSPDGHQWTAVRAFRLRARSPLQVGFAAQAPVGERCTATFSEIRYSPKRPNNMWTGE